jgi:repressor LexA
MLSEKQSELLDFIKQYANDHGFAPTFKEMMDGLNVRSKNTVSKHLESLEKAGMIRRLAGNARAIQIL